jgi:hypothetical protein
VILNAAPVNLGDIPQRLLASLVYGGGLFCGWLNLDNPTSGDF